MTHHETYVDRPRLILLALAVALLIGVLLCAALVWPRSSRAPSKLDLVRAQIAVARQRWLEREPPHYRLVVERSDMWMGLCRQEMEVRAGAIVTVARNACLPAQALPTVGTLFSTLEGYVDSPRCGPNGCACDGYIVPDVEYDPALGFPRHVRLWLERPAPSIGQRLALRLLNAVPAAVQGPVTRLIYKVAPSLWRPCTAVRFGGTSLLAAVTPLP